MEFIKKNKLNILLITAWLYAAVCASVFHEMWRDEAQAWCLARDAGFFELLKMTSIEGHPFLWHLLLFPAKLGIDVLYMHILSLLLVFAAVIYFVFKSPFGYLIKIPAVFSAGLVYFLPVIPRSYALIPILLFICADLYRKRHEYPYKYAAVLILISNTHALIFGLCTALLLLFIYESIKRAAAEKNLRVLIPSASAAACYSALFIFLSGTLSNSFAFKSFINYMKTQKSFIDILGDFPLLFFEFDFLPKSVSILIFYGLTALFAAVFFKYSKKIFFIFLSGFAGIFCIYAEMGFHGTAGQKAYILLLVLLFCLWIFNQSFKNRLADICGAAVFIISALNSFFCLPQDIIYNFSGSKSTAEYIKTNLNSEDIFCTIGAPMSFTPVTAYLPDKKFYSYINKFYFSYQDFSVKPSKMRDEEPFCRYFIVQRDFNMNEDYEIIFSSGDYILNDGEFAEVYAVYKKKAMI